jgi:hypothetical protein
MDPWQASHEAWWRADELRLQKLNRARGFGDEGLSLSDDDPLMKNIPHELRFLLPLNPNADAPAFVEGLPTLPVDTIGEHPAEQFLQKCRLDALIRVTPSSENNSDDWLAKMLNETNQLLSGRTALPSRAHIDDDGLLEKRDNSHMSALFRKISENAERAGCQIELEDPHALVRAMDAGDENSFVRVAERVLAQIRQTAALAA